MEWSDVALCEWCDAATAERRKVRVESAQPNESTNRFQSGCGYTTVRMEGAACERDDGEHYTANDMEMIAMENGAWSEVYRFRRGVPFPIIF